MRIAYLSALVFAFSFSVALGENNHVPADCPARLSELRSQIAETGPEVSRVSQRSAWLHQEVFARGNELLFFENELNQLSHSIRQHLEAESAYKWQRQQIDMRLNYLFSLPPYPQVQNEIFFLQNQQVQFFDQEITLNHNRFNLEVYATDLTSRVKVARMRLVEREQELAKVSKRHFELDRKLANDAVEIQYLSSLHGQNACSEVALAATQSELAAKRKLVEEISGIKSEADAVLKRSEQTKKKIRTLLAQINI